MIQRCNNNETMRGSNVPQMMLFGCKDEYIVPDAASEIIANQPQAGVVWLEDSGHMGFIEQPDKAAVAILEFAGKGKVPRNESDR